MMWRAASGSGNGKHQFTIETEEHKINERNFQKHLNVHRLQQRFLAGILGFARTSMEMHELYTGRTGFSPGLQIHMQFRL